MPIVGHRQSFDTPYLRARELIASGDLGRVRMIQAPNDTDHVYRPRRPDELDTGSGGGVVFSQAAPQVGPGGFPAAGVEAHPHSPAAGQQARHVRLAMLDSARTQADVGLAP